MGRAARSGERPQAAQPWFMTTSRAALGRGAAIHPNSYALYSGNVRTKLKLSAGCSQIAVPGGGPAMRGGLRPRFRAWRERQAMRNHVKRSVTLRVIIYAFFSEDARREPRAGRERAKRRAAMQSRPRHHPPDASAFSSDGAGK
jgi:hypothetical protein